MKRIEEYEIINHGVQHSDYFQGCGTKFTEFTDVATGAGNSEREALDDALEDLALADWDTESNADLQADYNRADDTDAVQAIIDEYADDIGVDEDGYPPEDYDTPWVFVSVRVR